jgi:hypothetical protein
VTKNPVSIGDFEFPSSHEDFTVDDKSRRAAIIEDDLRVYRAKIYKVLGPKDDRLQVLPVALSGISQDEQDNLPRFPPLIKGQVVTGKSISVDGEGKAEDVWILSTPDYTIGYVIGKANSFGENTKVKWPYSYNFSSAMDFIFGRQVNIDREFDSYDVSKFYSTKKGGMIELVNHQNGDWILFNMSGSIIAVTQKQVYLRTGTPPNPPTAGPVAFSHISIKADQVNIKSPNIVLDGKQITTGHHNLHLLGTPGTSPMITYGGQVAIPLDNTHG